MRTASSRLDRAASASHDTGYSEEHQPPLRPDAPKPTLSRSSTTTRRVGSCTSR